MDTAVIGAVSTVGFPIVVSLWFMWRMEPLIKTNNEVLSIVVEHLQNSKRKK